MEISPCQLVQLILNRLSTWEAGDIRSLTIHVYPCKGKTQVQMTWNDHKLELCPTEIAQCRVMHHSVMVEVKRCLIQALQTIIQAEGFGRVIITPLRKVESDADLIHFNVECVFSRRIKVAVDRHILSSTTKNNLTRNLI
jgi:hypothetical protein